MKKTNLKNKTAVELLRQWSILAALDIPYSGHFSVRHERLKKETSRFFRTTTKNSILDELLHNTAG